MVKEGYQSRNFKRIGVPGENVCGIGGSVVFLIKESI
jgi:hypothetical protein